MLTGRRLGCLQVLTLSFFAALMQTHTAAADSGIAETTGAIVVVPAPYSVVAQHCESNTEIRAFVERRMFRLSKDIATNISTPGRFTWPDVLSPGTIPSGTWVNSYFVHFDPLDSTPTMVNAVGSITFTSDILGVISVAPDVMATNGSLGAQYTRYDSSGRGAENGDFLTLSPDMRTLTLELRANTGSDDVRIITTTSLEEWLEPDLATLDTRDVYHNRAEQGIATDGSNWYTSKGSWIEPDKALYAFDRNWQLVDHEVHSDIGGNAVEHIGDIACFGSYLYAPVDVEVSGETVHKIARFKKSDLAISASWDVQGNVNLGGLAFHGGDLWGVEHTETGHARIVVLDASNPAGTPKAEYWITTENANGIAFDGEVVCVTAPTPWPIGVGHFGEAYIDVYTLPDILEASSSTEAAGPILGQLSYHAPLDLHAEGLTFKGDQLWVASGEYVSRLDRSAIPRGCSYSRDSTGSFGDPDVWDDGKVPGPADAATVSGGELLVTESSRLLHLFVRNLARIEQERQGTMTVGDVLDVVDGTYSVQGGILAAGKTYIGAGGNGVFEIAAPSADIVVAKLLHFGARGSLVAALGSRIRMTGSRFENEATEPSNYSDMINLAMAFEGGDGVIDLFEVAGEDLGAATLGEADNFALGLLEVGGDTEIGQVCLVDLFDNQPAWEGTEAQYLRALAVRPGSTLYLNGIDVYVNGVLVSPGDGSLYGGGTISAAPEPAVLSLLSLGGIVILRRRRR